MIEDCWAKTVATPTVASDQRTYQDLSRRLAGFIAEQRGLRMALRSEGRVDAAAENNRLCNELLRLLY